MAKCFLLTGGGTGAKIAEAYVHLCAAGCGPDDVHILIIDADTTNGNVARATATINVYEKVRPWGWRVRSAKTDKSVEFFRTAIHPYYLTERVSDVVGGSLYQSASADDALHDVLDLLYDEEEQNSDNQFGFLARPNLGSLILAEHFERQLRDAVPGIAFMRALRSALASDSEVQVMVAGSIFGGTGASLIPVARNCLLNVLELEPTDPDRSKLRFAAVMMMPYFSPRTKVATVDPARFLLDTSLALQYYGISQESLESSYDRIYLIGSDNPARTSHQLQNPVSGGKSQTNPAFVEEWLAALAVQHFVTFGKDPRSSADRVLVYNQTQDPITWEHLPWRVNGASPSVTERFSYLLHLAAFFVRAKGKTAGGLSAGLYSLLTHTPGQEIEYFGWFESLLDTWAKVACPAYNNLQSSGNAERWGTLQARVGESSANRLQGDIGEYFIRLLCWAHNALQTPGIDLLDSPTAAEVSRDYARIHSVMCDVQPSEIAQDGPINHFRDDNTLARLVRAALVAFLRDSDNQFSNKRAGGETIELRRKQSQIERAVVPYHQREDLEAAAASLGRRDAYTAYFGQK